VAPPKVNPRDWELIEADYRAGIKSTCEIASAHNITEGAIRKRAKAEGWQRDLSQKIRMRTEAALVRAEVRACKEDSPDERELVKAAVLTRVQISEHQRKRVTRLTQLADSIVARIKELRPAQEITDYVTADKAITVAEKAARTVGQLIALERQVWSMDDPKDDKSSTNASDELIRRLTTLASRENSA
jgi:hypothetical protein